MAPTNSQPVPAPVKRAALLNTAVVAGGYFLSRVLGIIRDIIINAQFGTNAQMDAYQAAFAIPDFLYLVIMGGALGSAFIPVFSGFLDAENHEDAWQLANGVLHVALVLMVLLAVLVAWQADSLVWLIWRDFSQPIHDLTVQLLRLLLIQPLLLGIGGLAKAALESFERFSVPALGSNLYNVGQIFGALVLAPFFGIYGLVIGVILGALLFVAVQIPSLVRQGYHYRLNLNLHTPGLPRIAWLIAPRLFGQSAWQLGLVISSGIVASIAIPGAVRANGIAYQLMLLPHGLLALSLGTVIFPRMSRAYAAGDTATLRQEAITAVRSVVFLTLPAAIVLWTLAVPIVRLLFERVNFTAASTMLTAEALRNYAIGLAAFAAAEIIVRTFYAMQDTLTPVLAGIVTVWLNIVLATAFLRGGYGIGGVGLAFSIAAITEALALLLILWLRWHTLDGLWGALARMGLASALFGAALLGLRLLSAPWLSSLQAGDTYTWPWDFLPLAIWTGAVLVVCGALYGGLAVLLRLPEAAALVGRIRRLIQR